VSAAWLEEAKDPVYGLFLATVAVCLIRAPNQPSVDVGAAGTTLSITPSDVLLLALLAAVLRVLVRDGLPPRGSRLVLAAAGAFGLWLFASSIPNGATATVAAAKLLELGVLTLAAAVLIDRAARLAPLLVVITAMTVVAAAIAAFGGLKDPGRRQESFLGEHNLATLSAFALAFGLFVLVTRRRELGRVPLLAGVFGAVGITFGASFSGLLGLYLVAAAVLLVARARGSLQARSVLLTGLVCVGITAGTLMLRSDNLGFLREWFGGSQSADSGSTAGSWSSRLIFAYVGGRVFLDHPVLGTGWYGELPPAEYAQYLPAAHARFPDQPANYFPPADGTYIPQQGYDQVLYLLGIVGAVLLLALGVVALRAAVLTARRWPRAGPHESTAYLPLTWLLATIGALAGTAFFGGTPLATLFWLALGLAAAGPTMLERAR
jgi:hypothetical protein